MESKTKLSASASNRNLVVSSGLGKDGGSNDVTFIGVDMMGLRDICLGITRPATMCRRSLRQASPALSEDADTDDDDLYDKIC